MKDYFRQIMKDPGRSFSIISTLDNSCRGMFQGNDFIAARALGFT